MIGVDVGGTFTDVIAVRDGRIHVAKVPTNTRESHLAVLEGARLVDAARSNVFNHASTHGLNSIITRRLPKVGFLTTQGHRDMLDIGRLWRPREASTDPSWRRGFSDVGRPLVPRYLRRGVEQRTSVSGEVVIPLNEEQARQQIAVLGKCEVAGVAICLLHSYASGAHEQRLRELVREHLGDIPCSISSDVSPLAKEYARASTTVVDVIMKLIYSDYTERLRRGLREQGFQGQLNYADSAAMLISADFAMEQPFRVVFAGPAAGASAGAHLGQTIGDNNLLCGDVGGTSCDISVVTQGRAYRQITFELEHDLVVNSLTTDISSLGAGGGSIISVNQLGEIRVGPDSAGADPGPAAYGKGGNRPTMTDACLLMGILDPAGIAGGKIALHPDLAKEAFERLDTQLPMKARVRAAWEIGLNNIVEGLYNIALKHGVDPRDYSLLAYGAAGPMILPALLGRVALKRVIVPPYPGVFSALGLLCSDLVYSDSRSAYVMLDAGAAPRIESVYREMEAKLRARIAGPTDGMRIVRTFDGRLYGQSWETPFIDVPAEITEKALVDIIEAFHVEYARRNGSSFRSISVEAVTFRTQIVIPSTKVTFPALDVRKDGTAKPAGTTILRHMQDGDVEAPVYDRAGLRAGDTIEGPAVIREQMSTTFVPSARRCDVGNIGELYVS